MNALIFCLSLIAIPLAVPFSFPFLPTINDLWGTKDFLVLLFGIIFIVLSPLKQNKNPWVTAFFIFLPISIYSAPQIRLIFGYQNIGGLWMWRDLAWWIFYFVLYSAIIGINLDHWWATSDNKGKIAKAISWGAIISAGYALLQAIGLDQYQGTRPFTDIGWRIQSVDVVANIGNPTYLATYLGICLPFIILFMSPWYTILTLIVLFICGSDFATVGAILSIILLTCLNCGKKFVQGFFIVGFLCIALIAGCWHKLSPSIEARGNGRLEVWREALVDIRSPSIIFTKNQDTPIEERNQIDLLNKINYSYTGRGLGSFPFIFSQKHKTEFNTPHNVYLLVLYELGIFGLVLFLGSIGWVLYKALQIPFDRFKSAVFVSYFFILFVAFGIPLETMNPLCYFSVAIFSILSALLI